MQNYTVDSIYFFPSLLKPVEMLIKHRRIKLSGDMFEFVCLNYSGKAFLIETFPSTR